MSKLKMDAFDASLLVLNTMAAFILVGIGTFDLFDVNFANELFNFGGYSLSAAWLVGYGSVIGTIVTNDNTDLASLGKIQNLENYYMLAAAATLTLPVAFIVFPNSVGWFFKSADLWGLVYVVILTSGQAALGWML